MIVDINACAGLLSAPERFSSPGRLARAASEKDEKRRMQGLAAELALSYALSGGELKPPRYGYDSAGRPFAENAFISLSHSGSFAACAVSETPVGVDIEQKRPVSPAIARRLLTPKEHEEFEREPENEKLLRRFVMKEAFFKMTGEGITGGMNALYPKEGRLFKKGVLAGFYREYDFEECLCCVVTEKDSEIVSIML